MMSAAATKTKPRVMSRGGIIACMVLTLLTPVGLLLIHLARGNAEAVERLYSRGWYHGMATALTALTGRVPFSVMEVILLLLGAAALVFLVLWIREAIRQKGRWWLVCLKRLWIIVSAASAVFFWFILTGDLNYYRIPMGQSLGLQTEATDVKTLRSLCHLLAGQAAELRPQCEEDSEGVFASSVTYAELAETATGAVTALDEIYGVQLFDLAGQTRPKAMYFSEVMSYIQLTGVIFPYISEPNINVHQPAYGISSTMCHELSHICGFMREDEANFIGYLACVSSENEAFRYSGYLTGWVYAGNALARADMKRYIELTNQLCEEARQDLDENSDFWNRYESRVSEAATRMNDTYLKMNSQADGVKSYGRMVDLMLSYRRIQQRFLNENLINLD